MTFRRAIIWFVVGVSVVAVGCGRESGDEGGKAGLVAEARQIVQDMDAGRFAAIRERFDDNLMKMLSEDQLAKAWEVFTNLKGELKSLTSTEVLERGQFTVVNVQVDMEREDGQVRVSFNRERQVGGFFLLNTGVPVPER